MSRIIHNIFVTSRILQLSIVTYITLIIKENVPIQFNVMGEITHYGSSSIYYYIIIVNAVVYTFLAFLGKRLKIELEMFRACKDEQERHNVEAEIRKKN